MEHTPDSIDAWVRLEHWYKIYSTSLTTTLGLFGAFITALLVWLNAPLLMILSCGIIAPGALAGGVLVAMRLIHRKRMQEIGPKLDEEYPEREALIEASKSPFEDPVKKWLNHRKNVRDMVPRITRATTVGLGLLLFTETELFQMFGMCFIVHAFVLGFIMYGDWRAQVKMQQRMLVGRSSDKKPT